MGVKLTGYNALRCRESNSKFAGNARCGKGWIARRQIHNAQRGIQRKDLHPKLGRREGRLLAFGLVGARLEGG